MTARLADHLRIANDVAKLFRHHPGGIRHHLSATRGAQRHGSGQPGFAILSR